jgi:ABC-2 type transport system ATP-binding protein
MLVATELTKRYAAKTVVNALSVSLKPGEVVGLLGPNGAGKSTTIGMLSGLIAPDTGGVTFNGTISGTVVGDNIKKHVGLVPQDIALFEDLSAETNLEIFGALYGLRGEDLQRRITDALALVQLTDRRKDAPKKFSGGMKRRLNIAAALLHDPAILLLDEPTVGVDPQARNAIFDNIEDLKRRGKAMLYSTHYMEEAERLCDRVLILDEGCVIANDTIANLQKKIPNSNVVTLTLGQPVSMSLIQPFASRMDGAPPEEVSQIQTLRLRLTSLSAELPAILNHLQTAGVQTTHIDSHRLGLEALFLHLTGRGLRESEVAVEPDTTTSLAHL